jgi:hypothetical protein
MNIIITLYFFSIVFSVDLTEYDFSGLARYFFTLLFKTLLVQHIMNGFNQRYIIFDLILGKFYLLIQHVTAMQQIVFVCNDVIFANYYLAEEIYVEDYNIGYCDCFGMNY